MRTTKNIFNFSFVSRYRFKLILYIAVFWTILDLFVLLTRSEPTYFSFASAIALRSFLVFVMSLGIGYLLVFKLRKIFLHYSLWLSFLLRSLILLLTAYILNYLVHAAHIVFILNMGIIEAFQRYGEDAFHPEWLAQKIIYWMALFFVTQLILEINEKYSPGVFMDILLGRYIEPKIESRIIMFLDLKDSTPIAEKLGHHQYFKFIRDFIHQISHAMMEHGGNIYQYVGDEVVVSWPSSRRSARRCIAALIEARRNLQKRSEDFRRNHGVLPEFRVGIHVGDVTVGEIGVIKKDIAMSGDTMNTTARLRTACSELNQKFIISDEMRELIDLKAWQTTPLGMVELKGKTNGIALYSLKI